MCHIFLANSHGPIWQSTHVSSSCLLKRNKRGPSVDLFHRLVCRLHSFFHGIVRFPMTITTSYLHTKKCIFETLFLHRCPHWPSHFLPQMECFHASFSLCCGCPKCWTRASGFASSNAVLTSKSTLFVFTNLPRCIMEFLSSCHSQNSSNRFATITCRCWQLIPSTSPTCKNSSFQALCSFSKRKKTQDAHHLDITDVLLCCFRFLSSGQRPVFLKKKTSFTIFHELRDSIRPRNRSWKHIATVQFFSMGNF